MNYSESKPIIPTRTSVWLVHARVDNQRVKQFLLIRPESATVAEIINEVKASGYRAFRVKNVAHGVIQDIKVYQVRSFDGRYVDQDMQVKLEPCPKEIQDEKHNQNELPT